MRDKAEDEGDGRVMVMEEGVNSRGKYTENNVNIFEG